MSVSNLSSIPLTWFSVIKSNWDYLQCGFLLCHSLCCQHPFHLNSVLSLRLLASASYNSFPLALFWGQQAAAWFFFFKYIFFLWRLSSKLFFPLTIKCNFLFLHTEVVIHRCIFICLEWAECSPSGYHPMSHSSRHYLVDGRWCILLYLSLKHHPELDLQFVK